LQARRVAAGDALRKDCDDGKGHCWRCV
jgi:hypothetical protein